VADFLKSGKTLSHEDLSETQDTIVTIKGMYKKTFKGRDGEEDDTKWMWEFNELDKPMVANITNLQLAAKATGISDDRQIIGKKIALYVKDDIEFGGKLVTGIRVRSKAVV
jgi:hypothetical protein